MSLQDYGRRQGRGTSWITFATSRSGYDKPNRLSHAVLILGFFCEGEKKRDDLTAEDMRCDGGKE